MSAAPACCDLALMLACWELQDIFFLCCLAALAVVVIVIVIGGLKSRGLTKTYVMCNEKISPVEILTIPGLTMLRADQ